MLCLWLAAQSLAAQIGFGKAQKMNHDWLFTLNDDSLYSHGQCDDARWRKLSLPHDWSIEGTASPHLASCTGYLPGGIGWYRKHFTINDTTLRHYIYFEGVYNRSTVYLNGHELGHRPNGYVSFSYDLTPHLKQGENVLAVRVDHSRSADSRWYTGSGIYRDVWLVKAPHTHLAQWGTQWKATGITSRKATVEVSTSLMKHRSDSRQLQIIARLIDADGHLVASARCNEKKNVASLQLNIKKPQLWNLDRPYLYTLQVQLMHGKQCMDSYSCRVGLRTLQFDADKGFALNGQWMKVKGVCLHHDAGVLGAAVPIEVWEYRLRQLKAMGCNAIRMSHNPQATALYDLCDEMGFLVMDEGSDEWEFPKRKWVQGWNVGTPSYEGSFDFFEEWIERDITHMVLRDRNHPCIFMWSVGNEVDYPNDPYSHPILDGAKINQPMYGGYKPDAPHASRIGKIAKRLAACIRKVDDSRPVTGALAGVVMSNETDYPQAVDVVGYNYTENRYAQDHATYPHRIIYGSETGTGYDAWLAVKNNDYIFGQFVWTGADYLGESGRWPSRGLNTGLLDFASHFKPNGHFRASMWSEQPVAYIGTYPTRQGDKHLSPYADDVWNYDEGQLIRVVSYTNAPQARLLLGDSIVGAMKPHNSQRGIIYWDIPFHPGTLTVEGCNEHGTCKSSYTITTSGRPWAIKASRVPINSKTDEPTALITLEIVDEQGVPVKLADNNITCRIHGAARLLGLENGDNTDMGNYRDASQRAYKGHLMAYIQLTGEADEAVEVQFTSPLLKKAVVQLH